MAVFLQEDLTKLLWNKFVVIIGDSNQRSVYKDLVNLLQHNSYTKASDLKTKGELSFMDDQLLHGGRKGKMMNGVNYREVRQYKTDYHLVRFYFVTRSYNEYVESIWEDLSGVPNPDVVIMNSCLWDVSRYGPTSMKKYKSNLERTFRAATDAMPPECLFIWNTALPVANKIKGGFLLPELDFLCSTLRLDVLEGNFYAKELASIYGLDVLDLHYLFRYQLHRRAADGVHWNHQAHRRITNLILAHIANAWGLDPPRHVDAQNRGLPSPEKTQPPALRVPSLPSALNFIDFDKPLHSADARKAEPKSIPTATGKMPEDHVKMVGSSRDVHAKSIALILTDDKDEKKAEAEISRPKSVEESRPVSTESRPVSTESRRMSADSRPMSAESRPKSVESRPKSAEGRPKTPPSNEAGLLAMPSIPPLNQPGLLGAPPGIRQITNVVSRPRQKSRFAPYSNNNYNLPPSTQYYGSTYNGPQQFNQYNNMPPTVYQCQPQMAYPGGNQYQADLQWRREQRMNRVMHDRGMELNWFGYNWA